MSLLLVLWGESYRSGKQMTRTRGTKNYLERQHIACDSHINLINKLNTEYKTDVFINTYKLNNIDDNNLIEYYKKNNVEILKYIFHDNIFSSEEHFLDNMYDNVNNLLETINYDYVILLRIDLYIKSMFIKNITLEPDKIQFPHIDSNMDFNMEHFFLTKEIAICHFIMICPKKFYDIIKKKIIYNTTHSIYNKILNSGISIDNVKFMLNTLHICSTDSGWNPLYIQVGREYKLLYNEIEGSTYIYENHNFVLDYEKSIGFCNEYMNKETEEYKFLLPILY
jgi:hypothetical protein